MNINNVVDVLLVEDNPQDAELTIKPYSFKLGTLNPDEKTLFSGKLQNSYQQQ